MFLYFQHQVEMFENLFSIFSALGLNVQNYCYVHSTLPIMKKICRNFASL